MSLEGDALKAATYEEEVDWVKAKLEDTGELTLNELYFLVHADLMTEVRSWIEANDVPWVDVIAALDDDRSVVRTWVHPDARGNRKIAEAFSDQILRRVCAD